MYSINVSCCALDLDQIFILQIGDTEAKQGKQAKGEVNGDIPHCGRVVKAVRDMEIIEQEIMAATGCNVRC